jgi:integrase
MATIRRRGKSWLLSFTDPHTGQRIRRSLGPITEAEAQLAATEGRLRGLSSSAGPAFADWAVTYAERRSSEYPDSYFRVYQILQSHLIPAFGPLPIAIIGPQEVDTYKRRRLEQVSPATVKKEIQTLKAMLHLAERWEIVPRTRVRAITAPRDPRDAPPHYYAREELGRLYAAELDPRPFQLPEDRELHRRYRWTWQLLANTGLRRGEAQALQWRNVGKEEIRVVSDEQARTKSGRWRMIPISTRAAEFLEALQGDRDFVLPRLAPRSLSRAFERTLARCELPGTLHSLRHTYCSHLVMSGVPLRTVQVLAGHASYQTTERYAHLARAIYAMPCAIWTSRQVPFR